MPGSEGQLESHATLPDVLLAVQAPVRIRAQRGTRLPVTHCDHCLALLPLLQHSGPASSPARPRKLRKYRLPEPGGPEEAGRLLAGGGLLSQVCCCAGEWGARQGLCLQSPHDLLLREGQQIMGGSHSLCSPQGLPPKSPGFLLREKGPKPNWGLPGVLISSLGA